MRHFICCVSSYIVLIWKLLFLQSKAKQGSVRRFGLQRLMDLILGVISTGVHPRMLVIGRVGRMGHGELTSTSYY